MPLFISMADLTAACLGLKVMVQEYRAEQIWLEEDSLIVINWINNSIISKMQNNLFLEDILAWKASRLACHVSRIYCEANQAAHFTANYALQGDIM